MLTPFFSRNWQSRQASAVYNSGMMSASLQVHACAKLVLWFAQCCGITAAIQRVRVVELDFVRRQHRSNRQHGYTTYINGISQVSCQNTWRHSSFCCTTSNFSQTSAVYTYKKPPTVCQKVIQNPKDIFSWGDEEREMKWETCRGKIRPCTSLPARARRRECKSAGGSRCQLPSRIGWRGSAGLYRPWSFSRRSPLTTAFISLLSFSTLLLLSAMFQ